MGLTQGISIVFTHRFPIFKYFRKSAKVFQRVKQQRHNDKLILTSIFIWQMGTRWYTLDLPVVSIDISHLSHPGVKARIPGEKKLVSSICRPVAMR